MYYAIIDGKIRAYHKSKKIVSKYVKGYCKSHPESACLLASGNKKTGLDKDQELIRVGKIYLQRKYEEAYNIYGCPDLCEINNSIALLKSSLLHEKNFITMLKMNDCISMLEDQKRSILQYIPSCKEMDEANASMMEYMYSMYN